MAKSSKKAKKRASKKSSGDEGQFFVAGSAGAKAAAVHNYTFDLLFEMIAERIRKGEDPTEAAEAVFDLAKEFSEADDVIFDDDEDVTVEGEEEKKKKKEKPDGD